MKFDLYVEVNDEKVLHKNILENLKEKWKAEGKLVKDLKNAEIYYKPLENKVYYIVNGTESRSFEM